MLTVSFELMLLYSCWQMHVANGTDGWIDDLWWWCVCVSSGMLTLSARTDRLQQQLQYDAQFLQPFYLQAQMRLNDCLQNYGVPMVTSLLLWW